MPGIEIDPLARSPSFPSSFLFIFRLVFSLSLSLCVSARVGENAELLPDVLYLHGFIPIPGAEIGGSETGHKRSRDKKRREKGGSRVSRGSGELRNSSPPLGKEDHLGREGEERRGSYAAK